MATQSCVLHFCSFYSEKSVQLQKKTRVSTFFHQRLDSFQNCARVAVVISVRLDFLARNLLPNQKPSDPQINVRSTQNAGDTNLCTNWSSRWVRMTQPSLRHREHRSPHSLYRGLGFRVEGLGYLEQACKTTLN